MKNIICSLSACSLLFVGISAYAEDPAAAYKQYNHGTPPAEYKGATQPPQHNTGNPQLTSDPLRGNVWTPEKCQVEVSKRRPAAEKCGNVSNPAKRDVCFQKLENSMRKFADRYRAELERMKSEFTRYEPQKQNEATKPEQPRQPASKDFVSGGTTKGHDHKGTGEHKGRHVASQGDRWPAGECERYAPKLRAEGEKCLKHRTEQTRRACFDQTGRKFPNGLFDNCGHVTEPIKAELEGKERQMYPGHASGTGHPQ